MNSRPPLAGTMAVLAALLCYGILTIWVQERWAVAAYQTGVFAVAAWWALRMAVKPFPMRWSRAFLLVAGTALWGLIQLAARQTVDRWETWNAVLTWSADLALFCLAFQFASDAVLRTRFLEVLLYFGFALSVAATVQMFTAGGLIFWAFPSGYSDYVLGPFVYHNQYAAFVEMVLPLALYQALRSPRHAFRYWLMAAILVSSVAAGASRTGSVLVLAEIIAVTGIAARRGAGLKRIARGLAQFVVLALIFTTVVGWDVLWRRFQQPDPYVVRRELLISSTQMVRERPGMGFGLGTWASAYPAFALYDDGLYANEAHNDWAQWAVEGGVPLVAMMLMLAALILRPATRSLWGLGLIAVLLHCFVDYPMQLQRPALSGWFFALAGVLLGGEIRCRHRDAAIAPVNTGVNGSASDLYVNFLK